MSVKETTRWHSPGIVADHRPGSHSHTMSKPGKEPPPRHYGIPWHIRHYIETGEGAKPSKTFVEPDGFAVVAGPDTRPRCVTEGCGNIISRHGEATLCGKCHKERYAQAIKKNRPAKHLERKPVCI